MNLFPRKQMHLTFQQFDIQLLQINDRPLSLGERPKAARTDFYFSEGTPIDKINIWQQKMRTRIISFYDSEVT